MTSDSSRHPGDERPLPDQDMWVLIADYVSGAATPDQRAAVEARRQTDTTFASHVAAARLVWQHTAAADDVPPGGMHTDEAWQRLAAKIDTQQDAVPRIPPARSAVDLRRRSSRPRWGMAALAASVVALAGIGITFSTDLVLDRTRAGADLPLVETVAGLGQRVAVTLPDGSRLMLAPGTTLRAPERFADEVRRVVLSGRAYFAVAHDAARPFVVETDDVIVRVIGTEFDLRAYPEASGAEVIVRDGRVAIRPPASTDPAATTDPAYGTVLDAGDRGTVDAAGDIRVDEGVDVDALLSWTDGRLVFERAPLVEVISDIERWHDVTIELADADLAPLRLTASFDREPLDIVLETVAQLVNAQVRRDGRQVVISRAASGR